MRKVKFRDPKTLTKEQLTDPDYAKKQIQRTAKASFKEAEKITLDITPKDDLLLK